jgi:hypothetical protein
MSELLGQQFVDRLELEGTEPTARGESGYVSWLVEDLPATALVEQADGRVCLTVSLGDESGSHFTTTALSLSTEQASELAATLEAAAGTLDTDE